MILLIRVENVDVYRDGGTVSLKTKVVRHIMNEILESIVEYLIHQDNSTIHCGGFPLSHDNEVTDVVEKELLKKSFNDYNDELYRQLNFNSKLLNRVKW